MDDIEITVPETTGQSTNDVLPQDNSTVQEPDPLPELPATAEVPISHDGADGLQTPESAVIAEAAATVFASAGPKPFVIALQLRPTGRPQHFLPAATVQIDPALRTSGLLAALPAEEVKTLVTLLTFLSPNGDIKPTAGEVAEGLHISESKAR